VVISPTRNTWSFYHIVQLTKQEHSKSDYTYVSYQTRVVCNELAWSRLTWLRVSLARIQCRLPNAPVKRIMYWQMNQISLLLGLLLECFNIRAKHTGRTFE
jgi:hypothetical protein